MKYSFLTGLKKSVIMMIVFAVPVLVGQFPDVANLTIGGLLVLFVNYLKVAQGLRI